MECMASLTCVTDNALYNDPGKNVYGCKLLMDPLQSKGTHRDILTALLYPGLIPVIDIHHRELAQVHFLVTLNDSHGAWITENNLATVNFIT